MSGRNTVHRKAETIYWLFKPCLILLTLIPLLAQTSAITTAKPAISTFMSPTMQGDGDPLPPLPDPREQDSPRPAPRLETQLTSVTPTITPGETVTLTLDIANIGDLAFSPRELQIFVTDGLHLLDIAPGETRPIPAPHPIKDKSEQPAPNLQLENEPISDSLPYLRNEKANPEPIKPITDTIPPLPIPTIPISHTTNWVLSLQLDRDAVGQKVVSIYAPRLLDTHVVFNREEQEKSAAFSGSGTAPEAWALQWEPPQISTFSGAATYGYSFDVPPGRAGLQPSLSIGYSSRNSDAFNHTHSSGDIAEGWNLAGIPSITRRDTQKCDYDGRIRVQNVFILSLNGQSYDLFPVIPANDYGEYQAEGNPSIKIIRHNDKNNDGSSHNITSEYWHVYTPDGTAYSFGYEADSEQIVFEAAGPDKACVETGMYTGKEPGVAVSTWWIDWVADIHGNQMRYVYNDNSSYETTHCTQGTICREIMEYPKEIRYNNRPGVWDSVIEFGWGSGSPVCITVLVATIPLFLHMANID